MFGNNAIRKKEQHDGSVLQVTGIWYTLQGEGPFAGMPAVFIRLTGCTLACWWCDTQWNDDGDPMVPVQEIVERVKAVMPPHCSLIVLTGGEPLRQSIGPLVEALHREVGSADGTLMVQVETSGSVYDDYLDKRSEADGLYIVCSPKTPKVNERLFARADCFKYVLVPGEVSAEDGLPIRSTQQEGKAATIARPREGAPVFISPCDMHDDGDPENALSYAQAGQVAMQFGYRLSLQMHKHVGAA